MRCTNSNQIWAASKCVSYVSQGQQYETRNKTPPLEFGTTSIIQDLEGSTEAWVFPLVCFQQLGPRVQSSATTGSCGGSSASSESQVYSSLPRRHVPEHYLVCGTYLLPYICPIFLGWEGGMCIGVPILQEQIEPQTPGCSHWRSRRPTQSLCRCRRPSCGQGNSKHEALV